MDYFANRAAYAKVCINKNKPKMHCNGKCRMIRQLQEEEKREQQEAVNKFEIKIALPANHSNISIVATTFIILNKAIPANIKAVATDVSLTIFHPPQVLFTV